MQVHGAGAQVYSVNRTVANEVPPVGSTAIGERVRHHQRGPHCSRQGHRERDDGTAAHIHERRDQNNGPVIIPFNKTADNVFEAPAGAKLTDAQYDAYTKGNLYINVHSAKYPGGEVRAQLKPK